MSSPDSLMHFAAQPTGALNPSIPEAAHASSSSDVLSAPSVSSVNTLEQNAKGMVQNATTGLARQRNKKNNITVPPPGDKSSAPQTNDLVQKVQEKEMRRKAKKDSGKIHDKAAALFVNEAQGQGAKFDKKSSRDDSVEEERVEAPLRVKHSCLLQDPRSAQLAKRKLVDVPAIIRSSPEYQALHRQKKEVKAALKTNIHEEMQQSLTERLLKRFMPGKEKSAEFYDFQGYLEANGKNALWNDFARSMQLSREESEKLNAANAALKSAKESYFKKYAVWDIFNIKGKYSTGDLQKIIVEYEGKFGSISFGAERNAASNPSEQELKKFFTDINSRYKSVVEPPLTADILAKIFLQARKTAPNSLEKAAAEMPSPERTLVEKQKAVLEAAEQEIVTARFKAAFGNVDGLKEAFDLFVAASSDNAYHTIRHFCHEYKRHSIARFHLLVDVYSEYESNMKFLFQQLEKHMGFTQGQILLLQGIIEDMMSMAAKGELGEEGNKFRAMQAAHPSSVKCKDEKSEKVFSYFKGGDPTLFKQYEDAHAMLFPGLFSWDYTRLRQKLREKLKFDIHENSDAELVETQKRLETLLKEIAKIEKQKKDVENIIQESMNEGSKITKQDYLQAKSELHELNKKYPDLCKQKNALGSKVEDLTNHVNLGNLKNFLSEVLQFSSKDIDRLEADIMGQKIEVKNLLSKITSPYPPVSNNLMADRGNILYETLLFINYCALLKSSETTHTYKYANNEALDFKMERKLIEGDDRGYKQLLAKGLITGIKSLNEASKGHTIKYQEPYLGLLKKKLETETKGDPSEWKKKSVLELLQINALYGARMALLSPDMLAREGVAEEKQEKRLSKLRDVLTPVSALPDQPSGSRKMMKKAAASSSKGSTKEAQPVQAV